MAATAHRARHRTAPTDSRRLVVVGCSCGWRYTAAEAGLLVAPHTKYRRMKMQKMLRRAWRRHLEEHVG